MRGMRSFESRLHCEWLTARVGSATLITAHKPGDPHTVEMMQGIEPMECLTAPLPESPAWAYEVKWDEYRALGSADWLLSRRAKRMNFPSVRDALRHLDVGIILDGEVVAFDILSHRGKSLLKMKWHERRAVLERALPSHPLLASLCIAGVGH